MSDDCALVELEWFLNGYNKCLIEINTFKWIFWEEEVS